MMTMELLISTLLLFLYYFKRHIEWYLSRGVDITVVMSTRDTTISHKGKLASHCQSEGTAKMEDEVALNLMADALEKYGKHGSMLGSAEKERVVTVNYESLMKLQDPYLFDLYNELGIKSTHVPQFKDGNVKYVVDPVEINPMYRKESKMAQFKEQPPKPISFPPPPRHEFFLPKRLITVVSLDSSRFLSTSLAVACGAFPEGGQWVEMKNEVVYENTIKRSVRSADGEIEVQHIILPTSTEECESGTAPIVEALAPSECSINVHDVKQVGPISDVAEQCKDEVFISEGNDSYGSKWTCGSTCGSGEFDGYSIYPSRYFVNISSHM